MPNSIAEIIAPFLNSKEISLDLETTSLKVSEARITHITFANEKEMGIIPLVGEDSFDYSSALKDLENLFSDDKLVYGWNFLYDLKILQKNGVKFKGKIADGMIGMKILNERYPYLGLKKAVSIFLNRNAVPFDEVRPGSLFYDEQKFRDYALADARNTYDLCTKIIAPKIDKEGMRKIWIDLEGETTKVLADMIVTGSYVDKNHLLKVINDLKPEIKESEIVLQKIAGTTFDPNSPKQVSNLLFKFLRIPTDDIPVGKSGLPGTGDKILEKLGNRHPILPKLREHRKLMKLQNMLVPIKDNFIEEDNRIRADFKQCGTRTSRLSVQNPNMQQVPKVPWNGTRAAYCAPKGNLLIQADFSQIEVRLFAWRANDPELIKAYQNKEDIYIAVAKKIFGDNIEDIAKARKITKVLVLGSLYLMGPKKISKTLNIPLNQGLKLYKQFMEAFPSIPRYRKEIEHQVFTKYFVLSMTGRRMHINPEVLKSYNEGHFGRHKDCEKCEVLNKEVRDAVNFTIQSSCADLIKICMRNIHTELRRLERETSLNEWKNAHLVNTVHDEVLVEIPEGIAVIAREMIQNIMEKSIILKTANGEVIPIIAEAQIVRNWGEAQLDPYKSDKDKPSRVSLYQSDGISKADIQNNFGLKIDDEAFQFSMV